MYWVVRDCSPGAALNSGKPRSRKALPSRNAPSSLQPPSDNLEGWGLGVVELGRRRGGG